MNKITHGNVYEIKIRIKEESDLYNPLDPDQETLSDDVTSYLEQKFSEQANIHGKPEVHFLSEKTVDEERVRRNFQTYIQREMDLLTKSQRRASVKQARLFLIGLLFIAVWLLIAVNTDNIVAEVLSIIGSFAVWEASDIWIVEAPEMRMKKRILKRLSETEIIFSVDEV